MHTGSSGRDRSFPEKAQVLIRRISENLRAEEESLTEEIIQMSNAKTVVRKATYLLIARK